MRLILITQKDSSERQLVNDLHDLDIETLQAETVTETRDLLTEHDIDAVVADLELNASVEVLAYLQNQQPTLRLILLSKVVSRTSLNGLPLLPQDVAAEQLVAELEVTSSGISLPQLLHVVAFHGCTCSVRVSAGARQGSIHFSAGELTDAYLFDEQLAGEAAALELLTWTNPKAEVREAKPSQDRFITRSLGELLRQGEATETKGTADAAPETLTESESSKQTESEQPGSDETAVTEGVTEVKSAETAPAASLADNPALAHLLEPAPARRTQRPSVTLQHLNRDLTALSAKEIPVADLRQTLEQEAQTLHQTFQALRARAREADEALSSVLGEVEAFREQQQRYGQAEIAYAERQARLEQLRSGAEALAQQLLSVVKQVDEEAVEPESKPETA